MAASWVASRRRLFRLSKSFLLGLLLVAWSAAGDEILVCPGNSTIGINYASTNATAGRLWIDGYSLGGIWDCELTIGSLNSTTSLWHLFNDGDPDGPTNTVDNLVLRLEGSMCPNPPCAYDANAAANIVDANLAPVSADVTLFSASAPLVSTSGFFTLSWTNNFLSYPGVGVTASFSSVPGKAKASPPPSPPLPAAAAAATSTIVRTLSGLLAAVASPSITVITVAAHIALNGTNLVLSGPPGRVLSIAADVSACRQLPYVSAAGRAIPSGLCALDARGLSRHATVRGGTSLRLTGLALVGGAALQGASVLVVGAGSALQAAGCFVADCNALGDGGGLLAVAGAAITVSSTVFINSNSAWGWGGGAAALYGATLSISNGSMTACSAQSGASVMAGFGSAATVSGTFIADGTSPGYAGGAAAIYFSQLTLQNGTTVQNCSAGLNGGGVFGYKLCNITMYDTFIYNNTCTYIGGIAAESMDTVTLVRTVMEGNSANTTAAAEIDPFVCTIEDCVVRNNVAEAGGCGGIAFHISLPYGVPISDALVSISGTLFDSNTAQSNGAAICVTTGVFLNVSGSTFVRNSGTTGPAIDFDGAEQDLFISNSTFSGNVATGAGCGAVAVSSAATIFVSNSTFDGNVGLGGAGGALCFSQLPAIQMTTACVAGQVLNLGSDGLNIPTGDISVVAAGQLVPSVPLLNCTWLLVPPAGCQSELRVAFLAQTEPNAYAFAVTDLGTMLPATAPIAGGIAPAIPPPILSSSDKGLEVSFVANNANIGTFATGFAGGYRSVCQGPNGTSLPNDRTIITFQDVIWRNNTADSNGGAVFVSLTQGLAGTRYARLTINGGSFLSNSALAGAGGGILIANGVDLMMTGTVLQGNVAAAGGGGGMRVTDAASVVLMDVTLLGNTCSGDGGGVSFAGPGAVSLAACSLRNNGAGTAGGGVAATNVTSLSLTTTACVGNVAGNDGGGLAALNVSVFAASGSNFTSNSGTGDGGAIYLSSPGATQGSLLGCVALDNSASGYGGAVAGSGGSLNLSISGSSIVNNAAGASGGGISAGTGVTLGLSSSLLSNNKAVTVSSIAPRRGRLLAGETHVESCAVLLTSNGGGLRVGPDAAAAVSHCTVSGNIASGAGGGAALESGAALRLSAATTFVNNTGIASGGAVAVIGAGVLTAADCSFTNNSGFYGGFLALNSGASSLANVSLMRLALSGQSASAGALYAAQDATETFMPPVCSGCTGDGGTASGWGALFALPPSRVQVGAPGRSTRTGSQFALNATLFDGFGQSVQAFPGLLASATCLLDFDPAANVTAACSSRALLGSMDATFRSGVALLGPLYLYGTPGHVYTLRVLMNSLPPPPGTRQEQLAAPLSAMVNVSIEPCLMLEVFDLDLSVCRCAPGATADSSTGVCVCAAGFLFIASPAPRCALAGAGEAAVPKWIIAVSTVLPAFGLALIVLAVVALLRRRSQRRALAGVTISPEELKVGRGKATKPLQASDLAGSQDAVTIVYRGARVLLEPLASAAQRAQGRSTRSQGQRSQATGSEARTASVASAGRAEEGEAARAGGSLADQSWRDGEDGRHRSLDGSWADLRSDDLAQRPSSDTPWRGSLEGGRSPSAFSSGQQHRSVSYADGTNGGASLDGQPNRNSVGSASGSEPKQQSWSQYNLLELCQLRHPAIVTTYGASTLAGRKMVVQEYHVGTMESAATALRTADFKVLENIAVNICAGCTFLHEAKPPIVVGLSPKVIMLDGFLAAKVRVLPRLLGPEGGAPETARDVYTAPELLAGAGKEVCGTLPADIYAFSMLLFQLFCRVEPFFAQAEIMQLDSILHGVAEYDLRPAFTPAAPKPLRALIRDAWIPNPSRRPHFSEVMELLTSAIEASQPELSAMHATEASIVRDLLPAHVMDALRAGKKVEPETFEEVTIFFSDIVGYTDMSATLTPEKVMNMLDRLYTEFDRLALKHGLFKVETIGDAFVAASGIPDWQPEHTLRIVNFALEAVSFANSTAVDLEDPSKGFVNIRVGFHVGSIVASVVGTSRLKYTLFGDTMNTASRMESNSVKNKINMSPAARKALLEQAPTVTCTSRGKLDIKGKGAMECFFLDDTPEAREVALSLPYTTVGAASYQI